MGQNGMGKEGVRYLKFSFPSDQKHPPSRRWSSKTDDAQKKRDRVSMENLSLVVRSGALRCSQRSSG
ncbi:hypothetical protein CGZ80_14695 [Rhodopirellula sp. MGV]|nr:hypothetical protein CGZ80_14695 [Rhodopirellula sp. MGV]PNY36909.1 hypothetical protein C2E31_10655 [Rhodopirellula baltica]